MFVNEKAATISEHQQDRYKQSLMFLNLLLPDTANVQEPVYANGVLVRDTFTFEGFVRVTIEALE